MKFNKDIKSSLWSLLEKYDTDTQYSKFCNSLSELIQDKVNADNLLIVFTTLSRLDSCDIKLINETIGADIDACLFSI